jgi:hypothetical protein
MPEEIKNDVFLKASTPIVAIASATALPIAASRFFMDKFPPWNFSEALI